MRIAIGIAILALTIGAYYLASPPAAVSGLRDAIIRGDKIELGDRVDFTRVRQSLKEQVNTLILGKSYEKLASTPFGSFAIGVASKLMEGMLDSFVTPAGLAELAKGRIPSDDPDAPEPSSDPSKPEPSERPEEPFSRARIDRESLDRFSAWVPADMGGEIRFVFRHQGLGWKLTDIILPANG
jgi:Protein of unknown function (DUF2939)